MENLVNKQLLLAAFYRLTYQHDSKDLIFATINCYYYIGGIIIYLIIYLFYY